MSADIAEIFIRVLVDTDPLDELGTDYAYAIGNAAEIGLRPSNHIQNSKIHPALLKAPLKGLIDIYSAPPEVRKSRLRGLGLSKDKTFIMGPPHVALAEEAIVASTDEFLANVSAFASHILSAVQEWQGVVIAGGAMEACLSYLPKNAKESVEERRLYFESKYKESDLDLFTYGLSTVQIAARAKALCEALCKLSGVRVEVRETRYAFSFYGEKRDRKIQLIKREFATPAHILAGFDIDAPASLFDGKKVWMAPRALLAMATRSNFLDFSRKSLDYELRLMKYALRGYAIYCPMSDLQASGTVPPTSRPLAHLTPQNIRVPTDCRTGIPGLLCMERALESYSALDKTHALAEFGRVRDGEDKGYSLPKAV